MKKLYYFIFVSIITLTSCVNEIEEDNLNTPQLLCGDIAIGIAYENNFETAKDTTGWYGITEDMFVNDPSPNGDEKSLHIGEGCMQPAAYVELDSIPTANYYLGLWGKATDSTQAGVVKLITGSPINYNRKEIAIVVNKPGWNFYETDSSLFCHADSTLRIEILIGGLKPADMFIDNLQIFEIK